MAPPRAERGQATVELVALLPLLVLLALLLWQAVVAGHAIWLSASAARAAARAGAVGGDPASAARATLPPRLEDGLRVTVAAHGAPRARGAPDIRDAPETRDAPASRHPGDTNGGEPGGVAVTVRIPSVLGDGALASTTARARFPAQAR